MAGSIFISYRWGATTSSDAVGRLSATLQQKLLKNAVVLDVQNRPSGVERLRERIQNQVKAADVMVIAIHPDWIEEMPRLHNKDDLVRLEIEAALEFGLKIIPVVLNGARLPEPSELPESIRALADMPAETVGVRDTYEAGIDRLAISIRRILPGRTLRGLSWLANSSPINVALALAIVGALMLFGSRVLDIHILHLAVDVQARLGAAPEAAVRIEREVGLLMAWNWALALVIITPAMFLLSATTLRHAKELLDGLQHRKMMYYVDEPGRSTPITARRLWEAVARPSAVWCQAFAALALVLGTYQWWLYSGQWYFKHTTFDLASFLQASTGPDWNIAWAIRDALTDGKPVIMSLAANAPIIAIFVLLMYLVYGIGSAVTYSYYAFLFNFFSELSQLATSAGVRSGQALRLDVSDRDAGGLAAFRTIQRDHAAFCLWTLFAMYLMALRNAYLPPVCRVPAGVAAMVGSDGAGLAQCSNMGSFASNIYYSAIHFVGTLLSGKPDFGVLFHTYSEQNPFVLGTALYVCLITSFFVLISSRMKSIVETARHHADPSIADNLLRRIRFENGRVIAIMAIGALSMVFLNLGALVVIVALVLFPLDYLWSRMSTRPKRQDVQAA
jgi:hypothetical protein